MLKKPINKLRKKSARGYFPPASAKDIVSVLASGGTRPYLNVQRFLDREPKKSLPEDIAVWLEQQGIKVGDDYILPEGMY